jgi:hypothetical protein
MNPDFKSLFPKFAAAARKAHPENLLPGASPRDLADIEASLGIPLPASYKTFLSLNRQLWLFGGSIQFGVQHPFTYVFPPLNELTAAQQSVVKRRGGVWPPPCQGLLCFAEYFWKADGDQVLFHTKLPAKDNDYAVYYYEHNAAPARISKVADSFRHWIENHCIQSMRQ